MDRASLIAAMTAAAEAAAKPRPVPLPTIGTVYVRDVTVAEVDADIEAAKKAEEDNKRGLVRSACRVICDQSGTRIFDEKSDADLALLGRLPWAVLQKVLAAADSTKTPGND